MITAQSKVSIFIVTFNQLEFVAEAIESAVNQDYENFEVVVSDDGSTDGTADIIADWRSRYPERVIALLGQKNVGVSANCNRALRGCTGDYITAMGGDDALLPGKIAAQVEWFERDQSRVLCGHGLLHMHRDGSDKLGARSPKIREGAGPAAFIRGCAIFPLQSVMVRASAIPSHGFDESLQIASDLLFAIEVLAGGGKFGYLDGAYYKYRHRPDSVSTRYFDMLDDLEKSFLIIAQRYPQYAAMCRDSITRHVLYFGGVRYLSAGNKVVARQRFIRSVQEKPLFLKAWLRLLQTV